MIQAMIFDLDGTLVQTERLKALSYARAAVELCPHSLREEEVIAAFREVVGLSRQEVAKTLLERMNLEEKARELMPIFRVSEPWQAYVQVRLRIYNEMLADPQVIRENQWPHNVALLQKARQWACKTALATMSHREQVNRVLELLGLQEAFDFVATRDDVVHGKPNPEIYQIVSRQLQLPPERCLVIEDSPAGVEAAVAAGMHVVAVSTPFTQVRLHDSRLIPESHIVDDPKHLLAAVDHIMTRHAQGASA